MGCLDDRTLPISRRPSLTGIIQRGGVRFCREQHTGTAGTGYQALNFCRPFPPNVPSAYQQTCRAVTITLMDQYPGVRRAGRSAFQPNAKLVPYLG